MENKKRQTVFSVNSDNKATRQISKLNARIVRLEDQLKALKKVEESLRESEENFKDIFETVKEGITYTTLTGKVLSVNNILEKMLGLSKEKLIGKNILKLAVEYLTSENLKIAIPAINNIVKGKDIHPFQIGYRDKILEVAVNINTHTKRLTGTIRDITESRRTTDALLKSEARLRRAELASKSGNWELHLKTGTMFGSEGAVKLYGVNESPMDYKIVKQIPLPEFRPMMDKAIDDLINHGKPYDIEFKIKNADTGEIIDIHSICEYERDNQVLFGSIQDITDRKKAEKVIMRNSRDLAQLLQITLDLLETVERKEVFKRILEGAIKLTELDT